MVDIFQDRWSWLHSLASSWAAALALEKIEATIASSILKIAGLRTGLGILLGIPATMLGGFLLSIAQTNVNNVELYLLLAAVRIASWLLPLSIFTKQIQLWPQAIAGSAWSCLFEWPAFKWAVAVPGQLHLCC